MTPPWKPSVVSLRAESSAAYADLLSARSETTLGFQGGVMSSAEVTEFERRADRADLVALRRADDAAKVRNAPVDPLDTWRPAVERVAAAH